VAFGIDLAGAARGNPPYLGDPPAGYADIRNMALGAGAVHDKAAANNQIQAAHLRRSL
jgi:hypothetical protein